MGNSTPMAWLSPDYYVGRVSQQVFEPYPLITNVNYSSIAVGSVFFERCVIPQPLALSNVNVMQTFNVSVPGATSQASTGSEAYSYAYSVGLFSRQDYSANSSNLTYVTSGSGGLTATMGYSSTSQQFGLSWVTNTSGGTSAFTTTSSDGAWSNFASGIKPMQLPLVTTLPAGEYWFGFQHSSTAGTSNSAVTLLSVSNLIQTGAGAVQQAIPLGFSASNGSVIQNFASLSTNWTTTATMAISALTNGQRPVWFAMSNA